MKKIVSVFIAFSVSCIHAMDNVETNSALKQPHRLSSSYSMNHYVAIPTSNSTQAVSTPASTPEHLQQPSVTELRSIERDYTEYARMQYVNACRKTYIIPLTTFVLGLYVANLQLRC